MSVTQNPTDANSRAVYNITGVAGEYFVAAELSRRGWIATLTLKNTPNIEDRTSTALLRSNQVRLYFSSITYLLPEALRRLGLKGTEFAQAQVMTIRLKILKIGALIRVTVRKIWIALAGGYPDAELWERIWRQLQQLPVRS
ncbi:MAG: transposase [Terriglobia bacterium]|jgi:UDP-N-acetylglucosamine enolpyruvyl transferase